MNTVEQRQAVYRAMAKHTFDRPSPATWVTACLRAKDMIDSIPSLAILDEDQELPKSIAAEIPLKTLYSRGYCVGWDDCVKAMIADGWEKILK